MFLQELSKKRKLSPSAEGQTSEGSGQPEGQASVGVTPKGDATPSNSETSGNLNQGTSDDALAPLQLELKSKPSENAESLTEVLGASLRQVSGAGAWSGKLAVTDRNLLETYVQDRIAREMQEKEVQIKRAIDSVISQTLGDGSPRAGAESRSPFALRNGGQNSAGPEQTNSATPPPQDLSHLPPAEYHLEWHHMCSNLRCYSESCNLCRCSKHVCGTGGQTVQPPPVAPYASAYWRDKQSPPAPEKAGCRSMVADASAFKWHLRAKCGQVVMVRLIDKATGQPVKSPLPGMRLVASLLGPYYKKESTHDVTFAKQEWSVEEYEQNKRQGPEPSIDFPELVPLNEVREGLLKSPLNGAYYVTNEAFAFNVSNTKGWKFRLGIQAVASAAHPTQPNGRPWTELMLKSEMFEVHNIRSKNDRAPDILSGLDEDVKLLKGVGRRAVEDLQKEGILQVRHLLAVSEDSTKHSMLGRILKKEMHSVLEHARTAVAPPVRLWSNPKPPEESCSLIGFTFCAEFTDRLGRLSVNFPLQMLLSNKTVYRMTDHELAGSSPMLPEELVPIKNMYLKAAEEDWVKENHPNWSHIEDIPTLNLLLPALLPPQLQGTSPTRTKRGSVGMPLNVSVTLTDQDSARVAVGNRANTSQAPEMGGQSKGWPPSITAGVHGMHAPPLLHLLHQATARDYPQSCIQGSDTKINLALQLNPSTFPQAYSMRLTSGQMDMADVARLPSFPEVPRNISNAENFSEAHIDPLEQWAKQGCYS